ncbi:hypothetical protein [Oceanobacillus salinisoli]|uniref:hypothetical protein n=1 Tax=Oceanobacillus salinisoli TaxID=2678611 RepID=UPI0012E13689|nr:hypothetical protein [Oceanobacillus salinisoli]
MERNQLYAKIPDELLGAFYIYIQNNIEKGTRIELMNNELELIEKEAMKRNIPLTQLQQIGLGFINNEMELLNKSL